MSGSRDTTHSSTFSANLPIPTFILMPFVHSNLLTMHAKTSCFIKHWPYSSRLGIFAQSASFTVSSKVASEKSRDKSHPERRRFHDNVADIDWLNANHKPLLTIAVPFRAPTAFVTSSPATFSHLAFPSTSRASKSPILSYSL